MPWALIGFPWETTLYLLCKQRYRNQISVCPCWDIWRRKTKSSPCTFCCLLWSVWNFIFEPNWSVALFSTYWGRVCVWDDCRSNNGHQPCTRGVWVPILAFTAGQLCSGKYTQHFHGVGLDRLLLQITNEGGLVRLVGSNGACGDLETLRRGGGGGGGAQTDFRNFLNWLTSTEPPLPPKISYAHHPTFFTHLLTSPGVCIH